MTGSGSTARGQTGSRAPARPDGGEGPRTGGEEKGPWTVLRLIRWSADYLTEKGVESGRLDAEHLLAHALGTSRLELYLQFDRPLTPPELDAYRPLLRRRAAREPLQYITGRTAFRELELRTDPRALIPRPETEVLVQHVLDWAAARGRDDLTAVDVGTGTGCIALSLLSEGPFGQVWAVDISADALELAGLNVEAAGAAERVRLVEGEGLAALPDPVQVDVVVSNPPYVRTGESASMAPEITEHEPASALFAGDDGLDVLRPLVTGAVDRLHPGGLLALEVGMDQGPDVLELIRRTGAFENEAVHRDLSGRPRVVTAVRRTGGTSRDR